MWYGDPTLPIIFSEFWRIASLSNWQALVYSQRKCLNNLLQEEEMFLDIFEDEYRTFQVCCILWQAPCTGMNNSGAVICNFAYVEMLFQDVRHEFRQHERLCVPFGFDSGLKFFVSEQAAERRVLDDGLVAFIAAHRHPVNGHRVSKPASVRARRAGEKGGCKM